MKRAALAGLAGVTVLLATACGGSSPAATTAATATTAAAPVKATGGGDFCKVIAASINHPPAMTNAQDAAKAITLIRKEEAQAVSLAPSAIKADVVLLMGASNAVWDAVAKAGYDDTKITAADMSPLSAPATVAAEHRVTAYMTGTCGITVGAPATP